MNMYEGDDLIVTDATCPNRLKVNTALLLLEHKRCYQLVNSLTEL